MQWLSLSLSLSLRSGTWNREINFFAPNRVRGESVLGSAVDRENEERTSYSFRPFLTLVKDLSRWFFPPSPLPAAERRLILFV